MKHPMTLAYIIGPSRGGTWFAYELLRMHPGVSGMAMSYTMANSPNNIEGEQLKRAFIESAHERIPNLTGSVLMDKTNDLIGIDRVLTAFDKVHLIWIVRDPRSVAFSHANVWVRQGYTFRQGLIRGAITWRNFAQHALRLPGMVLKYEDLVNIPSEILNSTWVYLGLKPLAETDIPFDRVPYGTSKDSSTQGYGIKRDGLDRWKNYLSEEDCRIIDQIVHKTRMRKLYEYERERPICLTKGLPLKDKFITILKLAYMGIYEYLPKFGFLKTFL